MLKNSPGISHFWNYIMQVHGPLITVWKWQGWLPASHSLKSLFLVQFLKKLLIQLGSLTALTFTKCFMVNWILWIFHRAESHCWSRTQKQRKGGRSSEVPSQCLQGPEWPSAVSTLQRTVVKPFVLCGERIMTFTLTHTAPRHCSGYEAYWNVASWSFLIK